MSDEKEKDIISETEEAIDDRQAEDITTFSDNISAEGDTPEQEKPVQDSDDDFAFFDLDSVDDTKPSEEDPKDPEPFAEDPLDELIFDDPFAEDAPPENTGQHPHIRDKVSKPLIKRKPRGQKSEKEKKGKKERREKEKGWFVAFAFGQIPVIGWLYLLYLAFSKRKRQFNEFARAWLLYRLCLFVCVIILIIIGIHILIPYAEWLLDYMEQL